jgi:flagellar basal body-associated protein FliL
MKAHKIIILTLIIAILSALGAAGIYFIKTKKNPFTVLTHQTDDDGSVQENSSGKVTPSVEVIQESASPSQTKPVIHPLSTPPAPPAKK